MISDGPTAGAGPDARDRDRVPDDRLSQDEVRAQLQRILDSPAFEASERRRRFLRYLVDESLAGRADRLKGYAIATAVFERDDSFDPQTDPVVRLEARRLRRALEHYYLTAGRDDSVRIEIPKGGYAPICERQTAVPPESVAAPALASNPLAVRFLASASAAVRKSTLSATGSAIALGAILAVAAAIAWFWLARPSDHSVARAPADSRLEAPAVIVLPFANLSGTAMDERFAEGLTEELISGLTRFEDLRVYADRDDLRKQGPPDLAALGEESDARYMVKGSVRRAAGGLRMTAHLIDAASGRYLWSESYDRAQNGDGSVTVQRELGAGLATRLAEPHGVVRQVTAGLLGEGRAEILRTYHCVSQAYTYRRTFSREHYQSARDCLEEAVRRDPSRPDAWAILAFAYLDEYRWYGFGPRHREAEALDQALAAAERAKELDRDSYLTLSAYAAVQFYRGNLDDAEAAQRRALTLNPNNPELLAQLGWRVAFTRDWDEGIAMVRQAIERGRTTHGWYFLILAFDDYRRGDCGATLADLARMGSTFFFISPALVAMCQAELGNQEAARRALEEALALDPTFAKDPRGAYRLHRVPEDLIDQFMVGLRKAGLEDLGA